MTEKVPEEPYATYESFAHNTKVYPNPAGTCISVNIPQDAINASIKLYDMT